MSKIAIRIVTFLLLVPCLNVDPSLAMTLSRQISYTAGRADSSSNSLFGQEAVVADLIGAAFQASLVRPHRVRFIKITLERAVIATHKFIEAVTRSLAQSNPSEKSALRTVPAIMISSDWIGNFGDVIGNALTTWGSPVVTTVFAVGTILGMWDLRKEKLTVSFNDLRFSIPSRDASLILGQLHPFGSANVLLYLLIPVMLALNVPFFCIPILITSFWFYHARAGLDFEWLVGKIDKKNKLLALAQEKIELLGRRPEEVRLKAISIEFSLQNFLRLLMSAHGFRDFNPTLSLWLDEPHHLRIFGKLFPSAIYVAPLEGWTSIGQKAKDMTRPLASSYFFS